jgi:hypothetical protein
MVTKNNIDNPAKSIAQYYIHEIFLRHTKYTVDIFTQYVKHIIMIKIPEFGFFY